ncbi:hypothetical protein N9L94_01095 [Robiginitalea sp.]|nr:hypothetical protein [Robiginitalea sp.]|tara:strand:- start:141 stop:683 length:543 start_codon:yes stop_codon:yes gene_type:complete
MKKILLLLLLLPLFISCEKDEIIPEPVFNLTLNGAEVDIENFYRVINTYGGIKKENGIVTKIFIIYLQRDDGDPRLNSEHFAVYIKDTNAIDNNQILDVGNYDHIGTDSKLIGLEIPGPDDYVVYANANVSDVNGRLISLTSIGEFWNPYQQAFYTAEVVLENYPIGEDVESTPYGYLID